MDQWGTELNALIKLKNTAQADIYEVLMISQVYSLCQLSVAESKALVDWWKDFCKNDHSADHTRFFRSLLSTERAMRLERY